MTILGLHSIFSAATLVQPTFQLKLRPVQKTAKSLVSEPLVAIFGIYAKFASQRNGSCLKRTLLDTVCGQKEATKRVPTRIVKLEKWKIGFDNSTLPFSLTILEHKASTFH